MAFGCVPGVGPGIRLPYIEPRGQCGRLPVALGLAIYIPGDLLLLHEPPSVIPRYVHDQRPPEKVRADDLPLLSPVPLLVPSLDNLKSFRDLVVLFELAAKTLFQSNLSFSIHPPFTNNSGRHHYIFSVPTSFL